jgi:hypothetical protein
MPPGIDKGWDYAPGANAATPLADLVEQKLVKLDAPIGAAMWDALEPAIAMERELKWAETLDGWLADKVTRGRTAIVGAFSPRTIAALADKGLPVPKTAEIALPDRLVVGQKQYRHEELQRNGLTESEWRRLPGVLQRAERVYIDTRSGKLIFVGDGADSATKIVVEFDPAKQKTAFNTVDTAFRVNAKDVEAAVRGKQWEPL